MDVLLVGVLLVGAWLVGVLDDELPPPGVLVVPCGTLFRRSPPSTLTSSRSVDWIGVVFVDVRWGLPFVDELPLLDDVLMGPGPDVVVEVSSVTDELDDGPFVEESLWGPELEVEVVSSGMSAVPRVFTCGGVVKLNLLPIAPAPWPRWRSLIELRPAPRKVFRGSMGKP